VHDNRGDGGVILSHGTNIQFYNNTVYDNLNGVGVNYKVIDTKIYNNTVYNNVGIGIEIQSGSVSANVQNNTVYANGTNIIDVGLATILSHNGPH
jgi:hypothetical protein